MRTKFYVKSSVILIAILIIFFVNFNYLKAETISQNVYSSLNIETIAFINRLNQLPQNFTFNQNLKRGTPVSPNVQYLKWILNSDTRTALTDNPNMTILESTSAFGPITETAVKKFQTLYRSEILDPQGITNATGVVGVATRQKLNWLLSQSRMIANSTDNSSLANNINNQGYNTNYVDFSYFNNQTSNSNTNSYTESLQSSTSTLNTTNSTTSAEKPTTTNTSLLNTYNTNNGSNVSNNSSGGLGILAIVGAAALLNGGAGAAGGAAGGAAKNAVTSAGTQTVLSQFGGKVMMNMLCPCSSNYLITLFDLSLNVPLSVIFQPGVSVLKMNYNPTVGQTVLGGYTRGTAVCLVYVGTGCSTYGTPWGTIDTLRGVGTTLVPVSK